MRPPSLSHDATLLITSDDDDPSIPPVTYKNSKPLARERKSSNHVIHSAENSSGHKHGRHHGHHHRHHHHHHHRHSHHGHHSHHGSHHGHHHHRQSRGSGSGSGAAAALSESLDCGEATEAERAKASARAKWVSDYVKDRVERGTTPIVESLLARNADRAIGEYVERFDAGSSGDDNNNNGGMLRRIGLVPSESPSSTTSNQLDHLQSQLRSRRAHSNIKCPDCNTMGYYRINCPKCPPVKVDIVNNANRPVTPEDVKLEKLRKEYDADPMRMAEAVDFKKTNVVKTATGLGNRAWFWKKDDEVWEQWDEEPLPESYYEKDFKDMDVNEVMNHFKESQNRGVSEHVTLIPGKLTSVKDKDKEDDAARKKIQDKHAKGADGDALADALRNTFGGGYKKIENDEQKKDVCVSNENSVLSNGTHLWNVNVLHKAKSTDVPLDEGVEQTKEAPERTRAEQNLHHVLHRLIAVVKTELSELVPQFAKSMLQPPNVKLGKTYYNTAIFKEHKSYFKRKMIKEESAVHSHQFKGNYRPPEKLEYCFDRKSDGPGAKGMENRIQSHRRMHTEFEGRHMSLHGVHDWLSVLGKNDKYATTGRAAEKAAQKLDKAFKDQKKWVESQQKHMEYRRDRCIHLMTLLEEELLVDEKREIELMGLKGKQFYKRTRELVKERSETADRVMRIMMEYNFLPGVEIADYLTYTVDLAKKCGVQVDSKERKTDKNTASGEEKNSPNSKKMRRRKSSLLSSGSGSPGTNGDESDYDSDSESSYSGSSYSGSSSSSSSSGSDSDSEREASPDVKKDSKQRRRSSSMGVRRSSTLGDKKGKKGEGKEKEGNVGGSLTKKKAKDEGDKKFGTKTSHMNNGLAEYGSARPSAKVSVVKKEAPRMSAAQRDKMSLVKKLNLDPADPYVATYFPHLPSKPKHIQTKEAKKNFKNAGLGRGVRRGDTEDCGTIPALMPLPDCYATGPVNQEAEKSYLATKIMNDLRARQVDGTTGGIKKHAVPLFHRVSMDVGQTYSDLVGRPFYFIDPNKMDVAKANAAKMAKGSQF